MSYLAIIAVFSISLLVEVFGTLYTISVARGNMPAAIAMSIAYSMISLQTTLLVVDDRYYYIPAVAGEVLGTFIALKIYKRGKPKRKKKVVCKPATWQPSRRFGRQNLKVGD